MSLQIVHPREQRDSISMQPELSWYAVYSRSRHEQRVYDRLCGANVEVFLPMMESVRQWSDRRKRIMLPLFPGYLFVKIYWNADSRLSVLKQPGVVRIISDYEKPAPIPEDQIMAIQRFIAHDIRMDPCPYVRLGQRVEIRKGVLRGLQGILLRKKGQFRFVVAVDLIQKAVSVEVNAEDLIPLY
jgi:transcription elongation factor/antiterminator RfaH